MAGVGNYRRRARILGLLFAMVALAACTGGGKPNGTEASPAPKQGGTAVIGTIADVDSWNEYLSRQSFANSLHRRIFLRLAQEMGDWSDHPPGYEPLLAESWSSSQDGKAITFRLRNAVWSDGRPITASDVRYTWKAQTSQNVAWTGAGSKARIIDVEIVDEHTVTFRFDAVYPEQLADAVEGGILPEHVFGQTPFAGWRTRDWSTLRIASGPFMLERHSPGEEIVLVRNPRYFRDGFPRLDKVVVRVVPDATSLLTQLLSGAVDYMEGVAPREAGRVRSGAGVKLIPFDFPMYDFIGWNGSRPPFDDPDVRRAMTLAIDRKALVEDLLYGYGRVSVGPILSFWWGADRTLEAWPYDPAEARRLLASRGWEPRANDGVLVKNGRPLEFEILTNAGNRLREAALVKIQAQLSRVGARIHPIPLEMQTLVQKVTGGTFDAYLGGWRFVGKLDLKPIFGSAETPPGGSNVVRYRSSEVDRLLDALSGEHDWRTMKPILASIERAIHRDQPCTFLYETQRLAAAGPRLRDAGIDIPADPLARLERFGLSP